MVKKIIKYILKKSGYQIQKIQKTDRLTMEGALQRCIDRGLTINSVIDVGASDGRWSRHCMRFFPQADYLLIEAQNEHKAGLDKIKAEYSNVDYIIAAAGNKEGKIFFDNSKLFGGLAMETPVGENYIEVPQTSIDSEIKKRKLKSPYLIKLDTHGFEVPILEGAVAALKESELVIIETYNFKLTPTSLKYYQMCDYMEKLGFSSVELADLMLRKSDKSFWQMDTFFIPSGRSEFESNAYE